MTSGLRERKKQQEEAVLPNLDAAPADLDLARRARKPGLTALEAQRAWIARSAKQYGDTIEDAKLDARLFVDAAMRFLEGGLAALRS